MSLGRVNKRTRDQVEWDNCFNPDRDLKPYIDNKIEVEVPQIIADKFPEELEKNETIIHEYIVPNIALYYVRKVLHHTGIAMDDYADFDDVLPTGIDARQIRKIEVSIFYDYQPTSESLAKTIQSAKTNGTVYTGTSITANTGYIDFSLKFCGSGSSAGGILINWDDSYNLEAKYKFKSWSGIAEGNYKADVYYDFWIYVEQ